MTRITKSYEELVWFISLFFSKYWVSSVRAECGRERVPTRSWHGSREVQPSLQEGCYSWWGEKSISCSDQMEIFTALECLFGIHCTLDTCMLRNGELGENRLATNADQPVNVVIPECRLLCKKHKKKLCKQHFLFIILRLLELDLFVETTRSNCILIWSGNLRYRFLQWRMMLWASVFALLSVMFKDFLVLEIVSYISSFDFYSAAFLSLTLL